MTQYPSILTATPTTGDSSNKRHIDLKAIRFFIGSRYSGGIERRVQRSKV